MYSIKKFAKMLDVSEQTLRNWDKNGKLTPIKLESGHRRFTDEHLYKVKKINHEKLNIIYCRESTKQQEHSLRDQESKAKEFCISNGIKIDKVISEYGSALNFNRKGLNELLKMINDKVIGVLVIFYKDRLVRFGFELFEELSKLNNFKIIIIDNSETNKTKETEFAEDLISIIHYFSMRLYGSRSYKKKIYSAEKNILEIKNEIIKSKT